MRPLRWLLLLACAGCGDVTVGCGVDTEPPAPEAAAAPVAHGDHSPHHGGVVMMQGDLHYEVVLDPAGKYRLYFPDATRADLPASAAASASITLMRAGESPEGVELQIDEAGESWIGQGRPVANPSTTKARMSYTIRGQEPYWIDLPFDIKATATDPHPK